MVDKAQQFRSLDIGWLQDFQAKFRGGIAHTFVLHGAIDDYVHPEGNEPVPLRSFLSTLLSTRPLIIYYNCSRGVDWASPDMRKIFAESSGVEVKVSGGTHERLLWDPYQGLPVLERILLDPNLKGKVALIIEYPELIWPGSDVSRLSERERIHLATLRRWATDRRFHAAGQPIFLLTGTHTDLQDSLRATSSCIEFIDIPYPTLTERERYVDYRLQSDDLTLEEGLTPRAVASLTGGLTRRLIEDICLRVGLDEGVITREAIRTRKDHIISQEYGDLLEILEPTGGFDTVGGMKELKEYLRRSVVDPLQGRGPISRVPSGVMLAGPPGTGKCVAGDSLVLTNKGMMKIEEIPHYYRVDPLTNQVYGAEVTSLDIDNTEIRQNPASHWYCLGKQKTIKIHTQVGASLEGTPEHPVIVQSHQGQLEFRTLETITTADRVALSFGSSTFGDNSLIDEETAYFMGLIVGDGCLTTGGHVDLTTKDKELSDFFVHYVKSRFPDTIVKQIDRNDITWSASSWDLKNYLMKLSLLPTRSPYKEIPPLIMQSPKKVQAAFLSGLFDADGWVQDGYVELSITCLECIEQVLYMLLNFGIISRLSDIKQKKTAAMPTAKPVRRLTLSGQNFIRFRDEIGFRLTRKALKIDEHLLTTEVGKNTNVDIFYNLTPMVNEVFTQLSAQRKSKEWIANLAHHTRQRDRITRDKLTQLLSYAYEHLDTPTPHMEYLQRLLDVNLVFAPVRRIDYGENVVYDFTVPDTHSFVSNGLISHNTLFAASLAQEAGVNVVKLNAGRLLGQYVGVSERNLERALACIRSLSPTIVLIDEIEQQFQRGTGSDGGVERRLFGRILEEMSGASGLKRGDIIWFAATNRIDRVDAALRRPGRFDRIVPILPPSREERWEMLRIKLDARVSMSDEEANSILRATEGYTGADLDGALIKAYELALDEDKEWADGEHVIRALRLIRPSHSAETQQMVDEALRHCNDLSLLAPMWHARAELLHLGKDPDLVEK